MSVPFIWVDGNLTVVLKSKSYQVLPDHTNYKMIVEDLPTATEDELLELVDIEKAVATFSDGQVTIVNSKVMFEGEEVHGSISKRILEFMSKGLPFQPLVKFLDNLMQNPSMQVSRSCTTSWSMRIYLLLKTVVSLRIKQSIVILKISIEEHSIIRLDKSAKCVEQK